MDMKTHIVRAVKYLIWLALLFTLVFALMISTGTSRVGAGEALHETASADTCLLTLIYDPGTADEETQQYRVTRGSYAMFACRTGSNIYYDAALSQEIDYQAGVDTSGESATVYIVPLEENR